MTEQLSRESEQEAGAAMPIVAGQPVRPLPIGHRIGELQIEAMLGGGGFGIVYRAFDLTLQRVVAVKEYMPSMLAVRHGDQTVSLRSERFAQAFDAGRSAFLNEARLLAQFDHPGLVKVLHFGASHGTAYMVTPFYEGRTLKQLLDGGMQMGEAQLREITAALLGALDTLHRAQCFHRDISLDNILIRPDGKPVLLDFGAARKQIGDLVDDSAMMLKPGYAPIEQYTDDPAFSQGPWTDLYALGAVMHAMVSGELPPAAVVRSIQDSYQPLASRKLAERDRYSQPFLAAIDHALQLRIADRPESVAQFASELGLQGFEPDAGAQRHGGMPATPAVTAGGEAEQSPQVTPRQEEPQAFHVPASEPDSADPAGPVHAQGAQATQAKQPTQPTQATSQLPLETQPQAAFGAGDGSRRSSRPTMLLAGVALLVVVVGGMAVAHFARPGKTTPQSASAPASVHPSGTQGAFAGSSLAAASVPHAQTGANREAPRASLDGSETAVAVAPPVSVARNTVAAVSVPEAASSPTQQQQQPQQALKPTDTVRVRFHVQPWGEVYVNGVKRGASPPLRSLSLSPGIYQIEIRNGTLPPLRRTLNIDVGGKPVSIDYKFE
jgi:non-specific serine/threonine protein kinase